MNYKITVLNAAVAVFLVGLIIYTLINYKKLSAGEGWGVVAMFGLASIGIVAGLVDLLLQYFIKSDRIINIAGLVVVVLAAIAIFYRK
ncbi:MAG: hypothetical protein ACFB0B_17875 [Thermonemataceae bacterium]